MVDCELYSERRARCHNVYGSNRGEECVHEALTEKRCLSMQRCPRKALEYYGNYNNNNSDVIIGGGMNSGGDFTKTNQDLRQNYGSETTNYQKALCASWAESFFYVGKELEHGEEVARHHREARRVVSNDSKLRKECRRIAMELAECLRATTKR